MANKIFTILGNNSKISSGKEVYIDLSIQSKPVLTNEIMLYKIDKLVNVKAILNSLKNIFLWIQGERVLNPEFGSKLKYYLYELITDENQEQVMAEIRHCITLWEPRVSLLKVVKVTDVNDIENNTIRLDIYYQILGLSDEQFRYSYEFMRHE